MSLYVRIGLIVLDAETADSLIKTCLILPNGIEHSQLPIKLLRESTNDPKWDRSHDWLVANCALVAYRAGQPTEAIEWTTRLKDLNWQPGTIALVVRAMAEEKVGQHAQAEKTLLKAEALIPADLRTLGAADYKGSLPAPIDSIAFDWGRPW